MAKNYKVGENYYLPVTVEEVTDGNYGVTIGFDDGAGEDTALIGNDHDLLLTATEIAENIAGRLCAECFPMRDEVKARNAELEALLKEVTATRDEAIQQINELLAENSKLKAGADKLKDTLVDRTKDVQHYKEENDRLKKTLEERAENVMNLLEENDKLKAERDKFSKTAKDKADLASKACTERDAAQGDLVTAREAIDYLQEENNKLKREVESRMTDYKLMRDNNAVYLSRITTQNEVINALVEKIRRLEKENETVCITKPV